MKAFPVTTRSATDELPTKKLCPKGKPLQGQHHHDTPKEEAKEERKEATRNPFEFSDSSDEDHVPVSAASKVPVATSKPLDTSAVKPIPSEKPKVGSAPMTKRKPKVAAGPVP